MRHLGILLLLVLLTSVPVHAAPPVSRPSSGNAPPPVAKGEPRKAPSLGPDQHARLAEDAYRAGNFDAALREFQRAWEGEPRPGFLFNQARCLQKLARHAEAIDKVKQYLESYRQTHKGSEAPNLRDALNLIRFLREREYERQPEVVIGSSPPRAQVTLVQSGRGLGLTPLTTRLAPGIYKLLITRPGYVDLEADLVVSRADRVRAVFTLKSIDGKAALSIWCNVRRVRVEVDGRVRGMTPLASRVHVAPGRHQVRLMRVGYHPIDEIIDVPEGKELQLSWRMAPAGLSVSWRAFVGWPLVAVGVGGFAGGVVAGREADAQYTGSPPFERWQAWQRAGYGAGAGLAVAGIGLLLWEALREEVPPVDRVPGLQRAPGQVLKPLTPQTPGRP